MFSHHCAMTFNLPAIVEHGPNIVGFFGGIVGIASGLAVFWVRRLRLVVTISQNNDAHCSWHTITIANRSDLALSVSGFALSWFITTPLGRLELNRAYEPEDEPEPLSLAPHSVGSFRIDDDGPGDDVWKEAQPFALRSSAYLRIYVVIPARGGGRWFPVRRSKWQDDTWRERFLSRWYNVNQSTGLGKLLAAPDPKP